MCMAEDHHENLWVGTHKGLHCIKNQRFIPLENENKLSPYAILDIHVDNVGQVNKGHKAGKGDKKGQEDN